MIIIGCAFCKSRDLSAGKSDLFHCNSCGRDLPLHETIIFQVPGNHLTRAPYPVAVNTLPAAVATIGDVHGYPSS